MNAPITLDGMRRLLTGAKQAGWEEGRAAAVNMLSRDYQLFGVEEKLFITDRVARLYAMDNPYGNVPARDAGAK